MIRSLGIEVKADLAGVGGNLQDHIATGGLVFHVEPPFGLVQPRLYSLATLVQWIFQRSGPMTILGGIEGLSWVNTKYQNASQDWPDVQYHFGAGSPATDGGILRQAHGLADHVWYPLPFPISAYRSRVNSRLTVSWSTTVSTLAFFRRRSPRGLG